MVLCWLNLQAQSHNVIGPAGDISSGSSISLEWTLGELSISTINHQSGMLTEGFHQPVLVVELIETNELPEKLVSPITSSAELQLVAAPNPVLSTLHVNLQSALEGEGQLELFSANSQLLSTQVALLDNNTTDIEMAHLAAGTYYLVLRNEQEHILKAVKIIKAH